MLSRRNAGWSTRWGMVLGVAALLAFVSSGAAQQNQTGKTKVNKPVQKTAKSEKAQKASPEIQKARAEVKTLHEQITKLGKEMHATREKMHKAWAHLAKLEGRKTEGFARHFGGRHHHGMAFARWGGWGPSFTRGMGAPWARHWARFHESQMIHHGERGTADVNARLQHLQHEIDALRSQLHTQQKSPQGH